MDNEILSSELKSRIERLMGARVEATSRVHGGYTPALRLRCQTVGGGRFFAKIGVTPLTAQFLRREIHVYSRIRGDFMPNLVAAEASEIEPILIIEDLSESMWPPPWDAKRVEMVREQIAAMQALKPDLETFAQVHGNDDLGWRTIAADPEPFLSLGMVDRAWLDAALPRLLEAEAACPTEGDCLTHLDLRSDNMCLTANRAVFVDWNHACLANPRLDLGGWLPSLAYEGGPLPETLLPDAPEVAAWLSGYFASRAGLPSIPDAPFVRRVQRQQLETALPWVARALGLGVVSSEWGVVSGE